MTPNDPWNPDDGPPPTDDERLAAHSLSLALDHPRTPSRIPGDPALDAALRIAQRLHATAHPDPESARPIASRVVSTVVSEASHPAWRRALRSRRTLAAVAAVSLLALGLNLGLSTLRPGPPQFAPITSGTTYDFTTALGENPGSAPAARLYRHRLDAYRDRLLRGAHR